MSEIQQSPEPAGPNRDALESEVFDALDGVYRLPPEDAIATAGLVAGQIAAFLADVAQLSSDDAESNAARRALADLIGDCNELAEAIRRSRIAPDRGGSDAAPQPQAVKPHAGDPGAGPSGVHNIAQFRPRSSHRGPRVTRT